MQKPKTSLLAVLAGAATLTLLVACTEREDELARQRAEGEQPGETVSLTAGELDRERDAVVAHAERVTQMGLDSFSRALPYMTTEAEPERGWTTPPAGASEETPVTD